jgi:hypothetical protein
MCAKMSKPTITVLTQACWYWVWCGGKGLFHPVRLFSRQLEPVNQNHTSLQITRRICLEVVSLKHIFYLTALKRFPLNFVQKANVKICSHTGTFLVLGTSIFF